MRWQTVVGLSASVTNKPKQGSDLSVSTSPLFSRQKRSAMTTEVAGSVCYGLSTSAPLPPSRPLGFPPADPTAYPGLKTPRADEAACEIGGSIPLTQACTYSSPESFLQPPKQKAS